MVPKIDKNIDSYYEHLGHILEASRQVDQMNLKQKRRHLVQTLKSMDVTQIEPLNKQSVLDQQGKNNVAKSKYKSTI